MDSRALTDIQGVLRQSVSWATDVDGDLVVGGLETNRTFEDHAFVYVVSTGEVTDLAETLGGQCRALAIDGTIVVGWVQIGADATAAFAYDHADGTVRILPSLGSVRATGISGQLVVGVAGTTVVVWDLAALS